MEQKPKLQVHITDYDLETALTDAVSGFVANSMGEKLEKRIEKEVVERIGDTVMDFTKRYTEEKLRGEIDRILTEGWARTNEWGEKKGEVITLATTVRDRLKKLTEENPNAYNRDDKPSLLQKIVTEKAAEAVKQGLQPLIDEAKKQLQTQLDVSIGKSLRLTLADALKGG